MSESMRQNTRGLTRHGVIVTVAVVDASSGKKLGQLVNIHTEGLMIVGDCGLQADQLYQLDLELPNPLGGATSIRLGVDCLWVRSAEDSTVNWAGCHIIDLSDDARQQIDALVQQMGN